MADEVRVEFASRTEIVRAIEDAQEVLLDKIDTIASKYGLDDGQVAKELRRIGEGDLADAWTEYVTDENYER